MATPQANKLAASQQGKTPQYAAATPGGSASTPAYSNLHAAFSPSGPRSSPQHVKKSPATAGAGGIMMSVGNSSSGQPGGGVSAPMNFDSPSAAAFNSMLGVGGFDASLDNMGMGMGGMALPRPNGEEERQKRLDEILHILGRKKGVVSEEGLERLVKRIGLDVLWEDRNNLKILAIAGTTFTLDIGMKDHKVQTVALQYAFSGDEVNKYKKEAEAILLENLKLKPEQIPWTKQLDDFANNLEPLAALDKLSIIDDKGSPVLVAYDAIAGIFESLQKVHEWDVKKLREDPAYSEKPEQYIRTIAMCEQNGRPWVHEKGVLGVGLEYWRDQRYHIPSAARAEAWYKAGKHWSIMVSCARRDPMVYTSAVRISDKWIGDEVEMAATEGLPQMLNWQEPPEVMMPEKPGDELLSLTGPRTPEVMFMAVVNPPVTLPVTVWEQIHHYTQAPVAHPAFMQTFDYLIFPAEENYNPTEPRMLQMDKSVRAKNKDGVFKEVLHENRLFIHKPAYGQTLTELPFSHPSQLVNMLPILRQYAFLWNLLDKSFGSQVQNPATPPAEPAATNGSATLTAKSDDFDTFMSHAQANADEPTPNAGVKVDVTLNALSLPNPKLQITFPFRGRPAQITVDIGRNGVVIVESTNVVNDEGQVLGANGEPLKGSGPRSQCSKERLARLLMFFEDIDTWCEFIRANVGPE
ncbi:hypothetical protein N0V93_000276 [Gnomoniopsis smithogilvyi]|uniref:Mediator of RNA polymerase II transcription subunit 1 n=1 Tax=Gnomoniopsis smithogilvyi TaxID=1191159 RepID=A0A9W8Z3D8_9PEZI|nr:hypothetical protein N0V93_000276 [Gnomoniopsis smithogilvyi]